MQKESKDVTMQSSPSISTIKTPPKWTKFLASGLGGAIGWLPIHPADVTKVRMQIDESALKGSSGTIRPHMLSTMNSIIKNEGFFGLYDGLSAALTRQLTYTTLRLGLYEVFREKIVEYNSIDLNINNSDNITIWQKLGCGLTAGALAASTCNPVEVALIRMQADGAEKNPILKRNYKNVFDAWIRVTKEEGFFTLYRGVKPTVVRGMIVSCVQLGSYDQAKYLIKTYSNLNILSAGPLLHFSASIVSGYLYCLASLPLDICKTRMQNQHKTGELIYKNIPQTLIKIVRNEGVFALWKGFIPYFARGGGHTICMFLCVEQIRNIINKQYQ